MVSNELVSIVMEPAHNVFREGSRLGLPQLGLRFFAGSNRWNVNGKPQNCEADAQE